MSNIIEKITAERDKKLLKILRETNEHYSKLSAEIHEETEKQILEYYREHREEIADILSLVMREIPQDIVSTSIAANIDSIDNQENASSPMLTERTSDSTSVNNIPSDDVSINQIYSTFSSYLNLLKETAPELHKQACDFIEQCVVNKSSILTDWSTQEKSCGVKNKMSRWDVSYRQMRQNPVTNQFNKINRLSPQRGLKIDYEGNASYTKGNLTVGILDYRKLFSNTTGNFNIATKRLMDMVTLEFTSNGNNPFIKIPLNIYMEKCGLRDKKKARKQVNEALDLLFATAISYDDSTKKNKSKNYMDMRIIEKKGIDNGVIYICFTQTFAAMLSNDCSIMPYPLALLKLSGGKSHPHAYYILRRMAEHKYMNAGKSNENTIAVRTLVEACDDLPTEEEVRNSTDRHLSKRIARPFMEDLEEACKQIGIGEVGYYLTYERGERIPDQELCDLPYDTFINAYIHFDEWPDYPDQTKRLETRKAKKATKHKTGKNI